MPLERGAAEAVNASALGARSGLVPAPEVVVSRVWAVDRVVPLAAEVGSLLNGRGGCCESKGCRAGYKKASKLHIEILYQSKGMG